MRQYCQVKKKTYFLLLALCYFTIYSVFAQEQKIADSLARIYKQDTAKETARLRLLLNLSFNEISSYKQAIKYADELIRLSQQAENDKYLSAGYALKGTKERLLGNLKEALAAFFMTAKISKRSHNVTGEGNAYAELGNTYSAAKNHLTAMRYYHDAIATLRRSNDSISLASALSNTGDEFVRVKSYDSALLYFNESKVIFDKINYISGKAYSVGNIGMVYATTGKSDLAERNIKMANAILDSLGDYPPICDYLLSLANMYLDQQRMDAALDVATRSLHLARQNNLKEEIRDAAFLLSQLYEKAGDPQRSLQYYKDYIIYRDSIVNTETLQAMADLRFNFQESQNQAEVNSLSKQKNVRGILLFVAIIILCVIIALVIKLLNNNRQKQKAYTLLRKEKDITEQQRDQTNKALQELKATQSQLIHRERMASLGELTAGIAHEIQNPLNFVNNFSEVNKELLLEMKEEIDKGNINEVKAIANNLIDNQEKINHHGKRADSIVKGMMQHARIGGGQKELTDINTLASEYLKLSYHAIRAKDKSFNVAMVTDFDESIQKINITPQDVGRLLLNIYNNAFYSVAEKSREQKQGYEPTVTVTTKRLNKNVEVRIKDNGMGIPQKIINKIFEPFFTTKPTGAGTGLGLSLSYDIIKAHGGTIEIETKEGEFAEFIIQLPISV